MPSLARGSNVYRAPKQAPVTSKARKHKKNSATIEAAASEPIANGLEPIDTIIDLDEPGVDSDQTLPPSTSQISSSVGSKRKRSALSNNTPDISESTSSFAHTTASGKKQRVSGAIALYGIKQSLDLFNDTIQDVMKRPEVAPTDSLIGKAMAALQLYEPNLDHASTGALLNLFKSEQEATAFLSIQDDSMRRWWVRDILRKLGITLDEREVV